MNFSEINDFSIDHAVSDFKSEIVYFRKEVFLKTKKGYEFGNFNENIFKYLIMATYMIGQYLIVRGVIEQKST